MFHVPLRAKVVEEDIVVQAARDGGRGGKWADILAATEQLPSQQPQ